MNKKFIIDFCPKTGFPHRYILDAIALGKNKRYEILCCEDCEDASIGWERIFVKGEKNEYTGSNGNN